MKNLKKRIRRTCGPAAGLLLFFAAGLHGARAQSSLKIMSYNVEDGMAKDTTADKQLFAAFLRQQRPDILGFEELNGFTPGRLKKLAASYGHPYAVLMTQGTYKVGLTSRFPIRDVLIRNDSMSHGFIMATTGGFHVVVAHLDPHSYLKRRQEIRIVLATIASVRREKKARWLIMGDLNSLSPMDTTFYDRDDRKRQMFLRDEKAHPAHHNLVDGKTHDFAVQQAVLDAGFVDSYHQIPGQSLRSGETTARIDYIYTSKNLEKRIAASGFVLDGFTKKMSDHRPVYLLLKR